MGINITISEAQAYTLSQALFIAARRVSEAGDNDTATEFDLVHKSLKDRLTDATAAFMVTATDDELAAWAKLNSVDVAKILISRGILRAATSRA